jgi:hypothetical protein
LTDEVVTVKEALTWPTGTVVFAGTVAADVLSLESTTNLPPESAVSLMVTVPVDVAPPITLAGLSLRAIGTMVQTLSAVFELIV